MNIYPFELYELGYEKEIFRPRWPDMFARPILVSEVRYALESRWKIQFTPEETEPLYFTIRSDMSSLAVASDTGCEISIVAIPFDAQGLDIPRLEKAALKKYASAVEYRFKEKIARLKDLSDFGDELRGDLGVEDPNDSKTISVDKLAPRQSESIRKLLASSD